MQHMLTAEAGARKSESVTEAIVIVTDNNLDNDTVAAAREAAEQGILVWFRVFEGLKLCIYLFFNLSFKC